MHTTLKQIGMLLALSLAMVALTVPLQAQQAPPAATPTPTVLSGQQPAPEATAATTALPGTQASGGEIPPGYVLVDGDMILPEALVQEGPQLQGLFQTNTWPNGVVPYQFDANVTSDNRDAMIEATKVLEAVVGVDFWHCTNNNCPASSDYVHIQNSTVNRSHVGRIGGQQVLEIVSWGSQFIIVHELCHALGLLHEHQRPDRNTFVNILEQNIDPSDPDIYNTNFPIIGDQSQYGPYDFDSLMHYSQYAFSRNAAITIKVKPPHDTFWQSRIGQRERLSALDIATLARLYPRPNWRWLGGEKPPGSSLTPYQTLSQALGDTPERGTLWIEPGSYWGVTVLSKPMTLTAGQGGVTLRR